MRETAVTTASPPSSSPPSSGPAPADLNDAVLDAEVRSFYGRQMMLLDEGDAAGWAETFTADASFTTPLWTARSRKVIEQIARTAHAERVAVGLTHRHLQSGLLVDRSEEALTCTSYVLVVEAGTHVPPRIHVSSVCRDALVREGGQLRVRSRLVSVDGRPVVS